MVNHPLSPEIMAAVPPEHLRIPAIKPYAGTTDPMDHLDLFTSHMMLWGSFLAHFAPLWRHQRSTMALVSLKQNQGESLKDSVSHFNMEALSIGNFDHSVAMVAFQNALRPGPFTQSLAKTPPITFTDILGWATKYINAEEVMQAKRAEHTKKKEKKKHPEEHKNEGRREDQKEKHRPQWETIDLPLSMLQERKSLPPLRTRTI
ncbi:uncharacterized protein LOC127804630 [Diospyros lotus]|uniref:uncharacterized protein LOC127804630 n=1 Tax=Diospyros lotus TaxID=55363 RepID=UPI002258E492|nr:uncharacterized protein LOC127804630 [Diospyros lotus]